jgi:hypothetical protein
MLTVMFVFSPFLEREIMTFPMRSLAFLCAVIFMLRAIYLTKPVFVAAVVVAVAVSILDGVVRYGYLSSLNASLRVMTLVTYAVFIAMSTVLLAKELFGARRVTKDTIMGGVCLYLNIGFLWAILYRIIYYFDKDAFGLSTKSHYFYSFYYSFTTLTTLGYGDICPQNSFAMVLSSLEAIIGQVYLAVFVARLVALHVSQQYQHELRMP